MESRLTTGIDIIEIGRVNNALINWQQAFLKRVYTPAELKLCGTDPARLAGRFAAKEAVLKALDSQAVLCNWHDIEILAAPNGRPVLALHGRALEESVKLGLIQMDISLSHCREYAVAMAVGRC